MVLAGAAFIAAPAWAQSCTQQWTPMPPGMAPSWDVLAFTKWVPPGSSRELLIAAGSFRYIGTEEVGYVAAWNGASWMPLGQGVGGTSFCVTRFPNPAGHDDILVGGVFGMAGGLPIKAIARWDGGMWHQLGGGLAHTNPAPGYPDVGAMAVLGSDLYVSGVIRFAGGTPVQNMARWDGTMWHGLAEERWVQDLHVYGNQLFAAGSWSDLAPPSWIGVIRWTGQSWVPVGTGTPANCFALGTWNGKLIATGISGIAAWDGSTWQPLGSGINGAGRALATFDPDGPGPAPELLVVGGSFTIAGGQPAARIAAWDGQNWQALGAGVNDRVEALAAYRGQLYVGGWFTQAGGMPSPYLARWGCPQPPPCWANCDDSTAQPILNVEDFTCFMSEFAAGMQLPPTQQVHHYTNCDHSTVPPALNVEDFTCFINQFAQGCR
jgi:trimeric autotransporter adhesin